MEPFEHSALEPSGQTFRILRLLRGSSSRIRCELEEVSRDSGAEYEALSYTWGSDERVERITVSNKTLWITENLHSALQHLRLNDADRVLWVDGICINQSDDSEKEQQVQRMGSIFGHAQRVIFWLGKPTMEIDVLMESLEMLQIELAKPNHDATDLGPSWWNRQSDKIRTLAEAGLRALLHRPWFTRIWIMQEVANARGAILCVGPRNVQSHLFALAPSLTGIVPDENITAVLDLMPGLHRETSWWADTPDLYALLLKFSHCKSMEERDKIFALLQLTSDESDRKAIPIDYEANTEHVIQNAFRYLFQRDHTEVHEILNIISGFHSLRATVFIGPQTHGQSMEDMLHNKIESVDVEGQIHIPKEPSLLVVDQPMPGTCYKQLIELQNLMALWCSKHRQKAPLRILQWRENEQIVKVLVCMYPNLAFWIAAEYGFDMLAKKMLDLGWAEAKMHSFALVKASEGGHEKVVRVLLEIGVDPNSCAESGRGSMTSALTAAASRGQVQVIRVLIRYGARPNMKGSGFEDNLPNITRLRPPGTFFNLYGHPLFAASLHGHIDAVKILLESGADVHAIAEDFDLKDDEHMPESGTALEAACACAHLDIVRLLLDFTSDTNPLHGSALVHACSDIGHHSAIIAEARTQIVLLLLETDVLREPVDKIPNDRKRMLFYDTLLNASGSYPQVVKIVLERWARPDVDWQRLLFHAICGSRELSIQYFLEYGASANVRDELDRSVLQYALLESESTMSVFKILLNNGADPDSDHRSLGPVLHVAILGCNYEALSLLLEHGGDARIQASSDNMYQDVVSAPGGQFMNPYRHEPNDDLKREANTHIVERLLRNGTEVTPVSKKGPIMTAFIVSVCIGNEKAQRLLIENGVDVNEQFQGLASGSVFSAMTWINNALEGAVFHDNIALMKYLLAKGAWCNDAVIKQARKKYSYGRTGPLELLKNLGFVEHIEVGAMDLDG